MSKKIVLGGVLIALIGILVAGAVIRTLDKTGNVAEARGGRGGNGRAEGSAAGQTVNGLMDRSGAADVAGNEPASPASLASVDEWLTFQGTVSSVSEDALTVSTSEGELLVENRPWLFAQEQGFAAAVGDELTLTGFYEDDAVEVGRIYNTTTGKSVDIRDENGRPLWAGRGRRGG